MATPVKTSTEADTKAETPSAKAAEVQVSAPKTADQERSEEKELATLREALAVAQAASAAKDSEIAMLNGVVRKVEKAKSQGDELPKVPRAMMTIMGSGRVEKQAGSILVPEDLIGLIQGVHYEVR